MNKIKPTILTLCFAFGFVACAGWKQTTRAIMTPAGVAACQELCRLLKVPEAEPFCISSADKVMEELLSAQRAAAARTKELHDAGVE